VSYPIYATYSGDADFAPSRSATQTIVLTTTLIISPSTIKVGSSATIKVQVAENLGPGNANGDREVHCIRSRPRFSYFAEWHGSTERLNDFLQAGNIQRDRQLFWRFHQCCFLGLDNCNTHALGGNPGFRIPIFHSNPRSHANPCSAASNPSSLDLIPCSAK